MFIYKLLDVCFQYKDTSIFFPVEAILEYSTDNSMNRNFL